jgi:hypothetical protein
VDTITRVVEAANEAEALNRAANQQRSLGFLIKEAAVMNSPKEENLHADEKEKKKKKVVGGDNEETDLAAAGGVKEANGTAAYPLLKKGEKLKPMKLKEGFDPDPSDIAAHLVKKHGKGKVTKDHVDAYEKDRDSNTAIDKEAVMKHVQKMSEEVEQVDEQSPAEIKAKYYHDQFNKVKPVKAYDKEGKLVGRYRSMDHAKQMKPGHTYKVEEDVELDEAQKKLKPSYWKAEWRLGTQSDVDKNNKKIFDRLAKTDPVKAAAFHDNLMRMKKKDVDAVHKSMEKEMQREEVELDEAATDTYKRANYLANKLGKKDPKKSYTYRNLAIKAAARSNNPTGIQAGQAHGMGNKAMRKRGLEPVWRPDRMDEVADPDKRDAGYKMSPAVRKAQAASDALSKREKKPQAGTLSAQKSRKAAEKMVNKAKGKANKINMTPELTPGEPND